MEGEPYIIFGKANWFKMVLVFYVWILLNVGICPRKFITDCWPCICNYAKGLILMKPNTVERLIEVYSIESFG
jgi:hypothetical protein